MPNPAPARGRQVNVFQLIALLLALVLVAGVGGLLAGGMLLPLAAASKTITDETVQVFDDLPEDLEPGPLSEMTRVYANDGKTIIARYWSENRLVVPLDKVSENLQHAVVATEDRRFWEHGGVDVEGTARAAVNNFTSDDLQGASTLTQQYVKNVLIEKAVRDGDELGVLRAREDSMERKLREAKLAIAIEKRLTKSEILESYLNISQFGVGVYGAETAARYYFGKSAKDLSVVEAATIAGVTKAPSGYDPTKAPDKAQSRRDTVLNLMYQQDYITKDEYDEARKTKIEDTLDVHPVENGCAATSTYAFFCDYVTKEITSNAAYGETASDRQQLLYRGGLKVYTTIDPKMQKAADKEIRSSVPADDQSGLEAAVTTVEPGTGNILAMAQNIPYDATDEPAERTTSVNYSADPTHGASKGFQVGSNFKPFVLAEWLRSGHTLNDVVSANKVERRVGDFKTSPCVGSLGNDVWEPANSEENVAGNMSVLKATYLSVNTAFASMGFELNLCDLRDTAWKMGFRPTTKSSPQGAVTLNDPVEDDVEVVAPMLIGTQASTPLYQAAAYATLASNGTYCTPRSITKIVDNEGNEIEVPAPDCDENALDPEVAATVVSAMENVLTIGTAYGRSLDGNRPAAGKTGTTQLSSQTWFTGFTPQLSTSVWVGNAESNSIDNKNVTVNGTFYPRLYGGSVAAPVWQSVMNTASEGMEVEDFPAPDPDKVGKPPAPKVVAPPASSGSSDDSSSDSDDSGSDSKPAEKKDDKPKSDDKSDD
ncbi:carboxypeptidase [Paraoerskovia sediminicola]|uniref:Carboxypeptidase n=1 Tax=Paraoerskovia sediminicola TaxID=1138587 RepID=A0ABN6XC44_9CELL|nr:transglycosylase domain-containing protein [Paraoerskovia sediminicola]BDZ42553.1 carboxypeptidase [Paraoerskovia sediminicola]